MKPDVRSKAVASKFPGLITNSNDSLIPMGASVIQENIQSITPGHLSVRKGWQRALTFNRSDIGSTVRDDLTNIYRYRHPGVDRIITVTQGGIIQARANSVVTDIRTGEYGDTSWSFVRDRTGPLIGINGFGRGIWWDGVSATAGYLGLDAPMTAPIVALVANPGPGIGVETVGDYICYYRYVSGDGGQFAYSNLSPGTKVVTAAPDIGLAFAWSAMDESVQARVHTIEMLRSLPGDENTLFIVGTVGLIPGGLTFSDNGGNLQINTNRIHNYLVGDQVTVTGSPSDDGTYTVTSVIDAYNILTSGVWSTTPAGPTASLVGTGSTTTWGDTELQDRAIADPATVTLLTSNNSLIANRFVPPPEHKHSLAKFQDRMFYAADATLESTDDVTITTTVGVTSVTLVGITVGTEWDLVGRILYIPGEPEPLVILSVDTSTTLTVNPPPANSTIQSQFVIRPKESERNKIYYSEPDEPQSVPRINVITVQEQAEDEDEIVGIHSFGPYLYILKEHHIYTLSYIRQPRIDAQARLLVNRGAFNKNCWDTYEGVAYVMDSSGCYVMGMNGAFNPISEQIQNFWRDGTIDITDTEWFFVRVDTKYSVARFYVRYEGDLGIRCRRALCYNIRTGAWWTEAYPLEISSATSIDEAGDRFNLGSTQNDIVADLTRGDADMFSQEVRGIVESSALNFIGDTNANFNDSYIGSTIAILDRNGRGQVRTILEVVSPILVRISNDQSPVIDFDQGQWNPIPDVGSKYMVGGINYRYQTGHYNVVKDEDYNRRGVTFNYLPTQKQYNVWVRRYWDEDLSPDLNVGSEDFGDGVYSKNGTPEFWIEIGTDTSQLGKRRGRNSIYFSGKSEIPMQGRWSLGVEIEGIKGDEPIEFKSVEIEGVEN